MVLFTARMLTNEPSFVGLITSKRPLLESKDELKARINEAAKYVPLEQLAISPQCGFASSHHGNPLTPDDQKKKLELEKKQKEKEKQKQQAMATDWNKRDKNKIKDKDKAQWEKAWLEKNPKYK